MEVTIIEYRNNPDEEIWTFYACFVDAGDADAFFFQMRGDYPNAVWRLRRAPVEPLRRPG